jgi:hypothetical protein
MSWDASSVHENVGRELATLSLRYGRWDVSILPLQTEAETRLPTGGSKATFPPLPHAVPDPMQIAPSYGTHSAI